MKRALGTALVVALAVPLGCATKARTGAAVGGGGGAAAGAGIGALFGGWKGAAIGAAVGGAAGGVAGAVIGRYMDMQEEALKRDMKTATIERQGDQLVVKFQSAILFDVNKTELKEDAKTELADLAKVLKDYPDTVLVIEGHTDSTGSGAHNKKLSEQRAETVIQVLATDGVDRSRLTPKGFGESTARSARRARLASWTIFPARANRWPVSTIRRTRCGG
ncbi:MAG: OmpA family protein [Deltaproteobacteria bacterium]|nr:MAG: OmpA family protein [Deltaproteobacteria bacterium]